MEHRSFLFPTHQSNASEVFAKGSPARHPVTASYKAWDPLKKGGFLEIDDKRRIPSYRPPRGWQMITGRANWHHSGLEGQVIMSLHRGFFSSAV